MSGGSSKCFLSLESRRISGCFSRRYSPAATRKPEVPQAGSQMRSLGWGWVSSTINWMLCRGATQILIGSLFGILAGGEDGVLDGLLGAVSQILLEDLLIVEAAEEKQVGDLLHYFQGIGDSAGSEGVPDAVNLAADFTSQLEAVVLWVD